MSDLLSGQLIVNTRPLHQQKGLTEGLRNEGAEVLLCPAIEIVAAPQTAMHRELAGTLHHYSLLIFVSANAVDYAFRFLRPDEFPRQIKIAAVGEGTQRTALQYLPDREHQIVRGQTSNSEGLLDTDALRSVDGDRVLIFRGQSGRNLLGDELSSRGASVDYCEVYRRQPPKKLCGELTKADVHPSLFLFTSNEGMNNFVGLAPESLRPGLLATPWLLISERMRESAQQLGHNAEIIIAGDASESGILRSVCEWVSLKKTKS